MKWWTCVVLLFATAVLADDEWMEVRLEQGPVRGRKHPGGGLYAFYNIPYATGPEGVDKFKAPLPPRTWQEPLDATNDKIVVCPQSDYMKDVLPGNEEVKEDCLIANIFVPETKQQNLSVLVYVHGGAFFGGFGDLFKGTQFIREKKDVIMVTFNYRLGIHGFLCLGTEGVPGNAGMKDQIALLRWVQKNIANFGGNPDDVTFAGNSAGSASVDLLLLSKSAEGLFHRVIPESGGNLAAFAIQRDPLRIAKTYAKELNELANVDDMDLLTQFYTTMSMELLTRDTFDNRSDTTLLFSPCVEPDTEGAFLTESPLTILRKGDYKKLPILYGFANMEGLLRIGFFETWKDMMNEKFSDFLPADLTFESDAEREEVATKIKRFYFGDDPVSNDSVLKYIDFFSDAMFTYPMLRAMKLYAESGNNQVYLYEYCFVDENTPLVIHTDVRGADHCAQSFAWLDTFDGSDESLATPEFQKVKKTVREIWHNFIKTGTPVPVGSSLPAWPAANANRSPHMVLNDTLKLSGVLLEERTRLWDDIYEKYFLDAVPPHSGAGSSAPKTMFNLFALLVLFYLTKMMIGE